MLNGFRFCLHIHLGIVRRRYQKKIEERCIQEGYKHIPLRAVDLHGGRAFGNFEIDGNAISGMESIFLVLFAIVGHIFQEF